MSKKLPVFKTDNEAEEFLGQDLSGFISAKNLAPFPFEYRPKQKSINLRISEELLSAVRAEARRQRIPYQRYIRQALESSLPGRQQVGRSSGPRR
ncbi:MAG: CopG family antitoxin [Candidatus Binataceae bacterium]